MFIFTIHSLRSCWDKDLTSSADNAALHMGDGWCTFADLDNFDNENLLNALTLKVSFPNLSNNHLF